jgi:site-specific DNA-methyltransferase (adenine-specific)
MSEGKKEILLGDCLELMKYIPNGSIDMILCDLPYGTTACKWDTIIPFDKLWEQYERIIKPNGAIVLFGSEPFSSVLRMSNIKRYKYDWIWDKVKPSGHLNAKIMPLKEHEIISIFSRGKCVYNPQGLEKIYKIQKKSNSDTTLGNGYSTFGKNNKTTIQTIGNYPRSILTFNKPSKTLHPTQKPIALFEYLIKTYTNEGDLVLDNTAGSGTTAIACLNTNRQFIVMEKEQKYYDIILKRVADFNKNFEPQTLFGNEW